MSRSTYPMNSNEFDFARRVFGGESTTRVAETSGPANRPRGPSNMAAADDRRQFDNSSRRRRDAAHGLHVPFDAASRQWCTQSQGPRLPRFDHRQRQHGKTLSSRDPPPVPNWRPQRAASVSTAPMSSTCHGPAFRPSVATSQAAPPFSVSQVRAASAAVGSRPGRACVAQHVVMIIPMLEG